MKLSQSMILLAVVMSGCSSAPTEQEIDAADFGLSMSEETCLAVATPFITQRMGDPESVIFENLKCYRGWRVVFRLLVLKRPMATDLPAMLIPKGRLAGIPA